MLLHTTAEISLFFGDAHHAFVPERNQGYVALSKFPFKSLTRYMNLEQLVFLRQVHGIAGKVITSRDKVQPVPSFVHDGDLLLTNVPHIGLGIATADCLPLILYDAAHKAVAIAHAGWRGAVAGIVQQAVTRMGDLYDTKPEDLQVFLGPSAQACCYQVQEDFLENIASFPHRDQIIRKVDEGLFFHLGRYVRLQLEDMGIQSSLINKEYHTCTICNPNFCSVRRSPGSKERQMTVVALR